MMPDTRQAALKAAIALLRDEGEEEHAEEIETLLEMFEPRKGDDPEAARGRQLVPAHCNNCGHSWGAMAMPAPLGATALTAQRLAQCARCFATEDVVLRQPGT
jgi:hypothetical protein